MQTKNEEFYDKVRSHHMWLIAPWYKVNVTQQLLTRNLVLIFSELLNKLVSRTPSVTSKSKNFGNFMGKAFSGFETMKFLSFWVHVYLARNIYLVCIMCTHVFLTFFYFIFYLFSLLLFFKLPTCFNIAIYQSVQVECI